MKNKIYNYMLVSCLAIMLGSCVSKQKIVYFQEIEGSQVNNEIVNFEPTLQKADLITINVSAIDTEAAQPFNLYQSTGAGVQKPIVYLINSNGDINFPVLGTLHVEGLTTQELTTSLATKLSIYLKNPIVNVKITNFKVTVLGEVKAPGAYTIENERISIIEAIGLAGDLTIQGERNNVLLIREQQGKRIFVNIDLTNKELFSSPYFYLTQNDVIYITPNKAKVNSSAVGPNTGVIFSSISLLLSIIALLIK